MIRIATLNDICYIECIQIMNDVVRSHEDIKKIIQAKNAYVYIDECVIVGYQLENEIGVHCRYSNSPKSSIISLALKKINENGRL